jgi:magnesium-transporting ATPase (P-type)
MSQTQSSKTASEVIKEMYLATIRVIYLVILFSLISGIIFIIYKAYLYFTGNTWQEIFMDLLIVSLPLIFGYSLFKQIKRVRQGGKA